MPIADYLKNSDELKKQNPQVFEQFVRRYEEGNLTRDENKDTHFSTFFLALDTENKEVFLGLHKKANLWLCNGGHIDQGETPNQTVAREIGEEWGLDSSKLHISGPECLTITKIANPNHPCKIHYDIWFVVFVSKSDFHPNQDLLQQEFHRNQWVKLSEIKNFVTDPSALEGLNFLRTKCCSGE